MERGGMYRGVVVEVRLSHVLVTAVDRESELMEIEGLGGTGGEGEEGAAAMKLLKSMVGKWIG